MSLKFQQNPVLRLRGITLILLVSFSGLNHADISMPLMSLSSSVSGEDQCPRWLPGQVVSVNESVTLPSNCNYNKVSFLIKKSNIIFDCNNNLLNGTGLVSKNKDLAAYTKETTPVDWAFNIFSNEGYSISNIEIRNCQIKNYIDGVRIRTALSTNTINQLKFGADTAVIEESLRKSAPQNIKLSNLSIVDSHKHGVYVDRYVNQVTIEKGSIRNAGNSGIYLESGTKNIVIQKMNLQHNGYSYYDRDRKMSWPRVGILRREAIAVDSSANSQITDNVFQDNGYGGVFLYKNCYEKHNDITQLPRLQHSDYNQITNNQFVNEKNGVWIASRQSLDLSNFDCGDESVYKWFFLKFYADHAEYNNVINNIFTNVEVGVNVEDDHNQILNNHFTGKSKNDIKVGSWVRSLLNDPVKNVIVDANNRF